MVVTLEDLVHAEHIFFEENAIFADDPLDSTMVMVKAYYNQGAHDMIERILQIFFDDDNAE